MGQYGVHKHSSCRLQSSLTFLVNKNWKVKDFSSIFLTLIYTDSGIFQDRCVQVINLINSC